MTSPLSWTNLLFQLPEAGLSNSQKGGEKEEFFL
jgi:hypothetical protein